MKKDFEDDDIVGLTCDYGKRLAVLVIRYLRLEAVDKLSVVITLLAVMGVVLAFGITAIYCICMGLVKILAAAVDSEILSFFIIGGVLVLLIVAFILLRGRLVTRPVIKYLASKFFSDEAVGKAEKGGSV